ILNSPQLGEDGDVALGDFNNDGRLDAAVGGEAALPDGLALFNGNGDGTFQQFLLQRVSTGGNDPFGVAAADLNGDGLVELVAATPPSTSAGVRLAPSPPVTAAPTTTTLRTSTATAVFGQIETLTATVTSPAGTPIGFVAFRDGDTVLGFEPIDAAGQATIPVSLGIGTHALTASFFGVTGFPANHSPATTLTLNPPARTPRAPPAGPDLSPPRWPPSRRGPPRRPARSRSRTATWSWGPSRSGPAARRRSRPASRPRAATSSPRSTTAL